MRIGRAVAALGLAALASAPALARADTPPSQWERVRDPDTAESYRLHVSAERVLLDMEDAKRFRSDLYDRFARDLKTSLEAWGAADSPDVRLRIDYGRVLLEVGEHAHAVQVLSSALPMAKSSPVEEEVQWLLGIACGHLGEHVCEQRAYVALLSLRNEDYERLVPMLNLAETEMHLGKMRDAIEDYKETLRLCARLPTDATTTLARWGLAVAYDRTGDRVAAEREAERALELARSMRQEQLLSSNGVFFYPDYEIHWYDGLAAVARARTASTAHEAAIHWAEAERKFSAYVRGAESRRDGVVDRWVAIAKARVVSSKAAREKAEKRKRTEPAVRTDDEEYPL